MLLIEVFTKSYTSIQLIQGNVLVLLITIYNCFLSLAHLLNIPQIVYSLTL